MFADLAYRVAAIFGRGRMDSELSEELQFHFEHQVDVFLEQGCTPQEARRRARLLFGGLEQVKDECRDARGIAFFETMGRDLRYAVRLLSASPGFAVTAILSLALAIAASTLAFSSLVQAGLRPLPVKSPDELVFLRSPGPHPGFCWGAGASDATCFSYPTYRDLCDRNTVFSGLLARSNLGAGLTFHRRSERVSLEMVSRNYFELLGVEPAAGRLFGSRDDSRTGTLRVAVLSDTYWTRRFRRDPAVVGQRAFLNNLPVTIFGIAAPGIDSLTPGHSPDLFVPLDLEDVLIPGQPMLSDRGMAWMNIVGRLQPGMARQRAQAELAPLYRQLIRAEAANIPASWTGRQQFLSRRLDLLPARRGIEPRIVETLLSLSGIAVCVLLAACANLAGLSLARAAARQKEIAIRVALGAGRGRMARQLLAEFLLPASAGALSGLLIAFAIHGAIPKILFDPERARTFASNPGPGVLLLAFAVSLAAAFLFGAAPALLPALSAPLRALNTATVVPLGLSHARFRKALVMAQVALSAGLMFGAFSFSRDMFKRNNGKPGPEKENMIFFLMDAGSRGYYSPQAERLFRRLEQSLAALPGVRGVGFASGSLARFEVEGRPLETPPDSRVYWVQISPGFLANTGCLIVEGHGVGSERGWPPRAVLVNENFKRLFFDGRSPLGKHVNMAGGAPAEVVGVVRDEGSPVASSLPSVYYSYTGATTVGYYVRTAGTPELLIPAVKALVEREAPDVPLYDLKTTAAFLAENLRFDRLMVTVLCIFGLLTMALAAVGAYGVTNYVVTRRTSEIGLRMALGATAVSVVGTVMQEILCMVGLGAIAGLLLPPIACAFLFPANGPNWAEEYPVVVAGTLVVAAAAALAGFLPALRAARIAPASALRAE